jgi:chromosome segregation ATPase
MLGLGIVAMSSTPIRAAAPRTSDVTKHLDAIEEAQRSLAADIGLLRDQLDDLKQGLDEVREQIRQGDDAAQGDRDQLKGMREEVRGLYVESSGLKGDIAEVGKEVQGVNENFGNFRYSAGALIAVVIVLQLVVVALGLRGRG